MARRRSRRSNTRRRLFWARENQWQRFNPSTEDVHGLQPVNLLERFESEYGADLVGFTIARIRGHVSVWYDETTAQTRNEFSWGIRVATESSVATAGTGNERAGLTPISDPHADWMLTHADMNQLSNTATSGLGWREYRWEVDLKSKRRMDELGQSVFLFAGWTGFSGPPSPLSGTRDTSIQLNILCMKP